MKVPNLFLIGAPKAGTSAIADALMRHPEVYCQRKEPRFFDANVFYDDASKAPVPTFEEYLRLYSAPAAQESKYRLDASVFVMYSIQAVTNILDLSPDARFIIALRDPIEASQSMFHQRLKYPNEEMREISEDFNYCWRLLPHRRKNKGFPKGCNTRNLFRYDFLYHYERHIPTLIDTIPEHQLKIVFYEDFKKKPGCVMEDIASFCGISFNEFEGVNKVNTSYLSRQTPYNKLKFSFSHRLALSTEGIRLKYPFLKTLGHVARPFLLPKEEPFPEHTFIDCATRAEMLEEFSMTYDYVQTFRKKIGENNGSK